MPPEADMGAAQGAGNNSSDFVSNFALHSSTRDGLVADGCMCIELTYCAPKPGSQTLQVNTPFRTQSVPCPPQFAILTGYPV
jgi:hypothetical protein